MSSQLLRRESWVLGKHSEDLLGGFHLGMLQIMNILNIHGFPITFPQKNPAQMGVSINLNGCTGCTPIAGWFIMEMPSIKGWFGNLGVPPILGNLQMILIAPGARLFSRLSASLMSLVLALRIARQSPCRCVQLRGKPMSRDKYPGWLVVINVSKQYHKPHSLMVYIPFMVNGGMVYYCFTTIIEEPIKHHTTWFRNSCHPQWQLLSVGEVCWWWLMVTGQGAPLDTAFFQTTASGAPWPMAGLIIEVALPRSPISGATFGWTFDILPLDLPNYLISPYCVWIKRCWLDWAMVAVRFWEFQPNSWCTAAGMLPSHS